MTLEAEESGNRGDGGGAASPFPSDADIAVNGNYAIEAGPKVSDAQQPNSPVLAATTYETLWL